MPRSVTPWVRRPMLWLVLIGSFATPVRAQEMELPVEVQMTMISRILGFDRAFEDRVEGEEVVIGVAYQARNRESVNAMTAFGEAIEVPGFAINGLPVRAVPIDLEAQRDLRGRMDREDLDFLYITPLRAANLSTLVRVAHELGVTTLSGVPDYAMDGAAVSVGRRASRPEIIINLPSCDALGVAFSSRLLELARLVGGAADGS